MCHFDLNWQEKWKIKILSATLKIAVFLLLLLLFTFC